MDDTTCRTHHIEYLHIGLPFHKPNRELDVTCREHCVKVFVSWCLSTNSTQTTVHQLELQIECAFHGISLLAGDIHPNAGPRPKVPSPPSLGVNKHRSCKQTKVSIAHFLMFTATTGQCNAYIHAYIHTYIHTYTHTYTKTNQNTPTKMDTYHYSSETLWHCSKDWVYHFLSLWVQHEDMIKAVLCHGCI